MGPGGLLDGLGGGRYFGVRVLGYEVVVMVWEGWWEVRDGCIPLEWIARVVPGMKLRWFGRVSCNRLDREWSRLEGHWQLASL